MTGFKETLESIKAKQFHAVGELVGNPSDTRRTKSHFESSLCMKDPLFAEKFYLMVESDPQTHEDASYYPIFKTSMK